MVDDSHNRMRDPVDAFSRYTISADHHRYPDIPVVQLLFIRQFNFILSGALMSRAEIRGPAVNRSTRMTQNPIDRGCLNSRCSTSVLVHCGSFDHSESSRIAGVPVRPLHLELSHPAEYPDLIEYLSIPSDDAIPVLPVEALILLKLSAGRPQDIADVSSLLEAGADIDNVIIYLKKAAPDLLVKFAEIIS